MASTGPTSCRLALTATGDDGMDGQAVAYDVRISDRPIADGRAPAGSVSFDRADRVPSATPRAGGEADTIEIQFEPAATARRYWVAVKVIDNAGNTSDMVTREVAVPPGGVVS